ncbi:hypothetical protein FQN49_005371 [Arthroderma sp. PD_2]|nr:hypothetical protein FQN49_005371 [Arthroderma sp. PD_2]
MFTLQQGRYIIFVAHGFGGIIVKELLRRAAVEEDAELLDVRNSTKAIIFMGTPHRGSSLAPSRETMRKIISACGFDTNDKNIRAQHFDSTELEVSREDFMRQWRQERFIVRTFQESLGYGGFIGRNRKMAMDMSSSLDDPREHAEHINANHRNMCRFTGREDPGYQQVGGELRRIANTLRHEHQESEQRMLEAKSAISEDEEKLSSEELKCLQSLSVPGIDGREYTVSEDIQATCTWLFHQQEYRSWKDLSDKRSQNTLLRIQGKLGSGKSTLLKVAMSKLRKENADSSSVKLSFFFKRWGSLLERSQIGLFRSLIFQLLQQSKPTLRNCMPIFQRKVKPYDSEWAWNVQELKDFFMSVVTECPPSSTYIFIDALDECKDARDVITFFESLRVTAFQNEAVVRICYSSRHYPPIEVKACHNLLINSHNDFDIESYIERKLEPLSQRRHIANLKSYIIEKTQGIFLWVVLIVSAILEAYDHGESIKNMKKVVKHTPHELEALYREQVEAVKTEHVAETLLILQWMLSATRPLTLLELRYGLAFQNNQYKSQEDAENCLSFIESDQQMDLLREARTGSLTAIKPLEATPTNYARQIFDLDNQFTIHFVHDSVKKFLLKQGGLQQLDFDSTQEILRRGQHQLAEACINCLNTTELRDIADSYAEAHTLSIAESAELFQKLCRHYPFLHYSLHSVFEHIKAAEACQSTGKGHALYLYQRMEGVFSVWRFLSDIDNRSRFHELHDTGTALVHLAAEHNMIDWVKYYLASGGNANLEGGRFGTLLQAAAGMGHEEMVELLLDGGADVHAVSGRLGSALSAAASEGNLPIVKSLIQRGADVNYECGEHGCALQAAVSSPDGSRELVNTLLDAGADIHMQRGKYGTVLQAAAFKGDDEIVKCLLARGADMNAQCGDHGTALGAAASGGHEKVVQLFLDKGADPSVEGGNRGNPIWAAACKGHGHIIRQILGHQNPSWEQDMVNGEAQNILNEATRSNEFHEAVENGELDLVNKFIEDGIDPNVRGGDFSSALHTAAMYGHDDIAVLLLAQEKIKVDVQDSRGRTPLWQAASNGHLEITKKLLDTGRVNIQQKSLTGRNLLWYAANSGQMNLIRLLREAGADLYEPDADGITPIMAAEEEGLQEVVLFLQKDMNEN